MKAELEQQKKLAQILYISGNMPQKEIAAMTGISEHTISVWKKEGEWDNLIPELATSNEQELARLRKILNKLNIEADKALSDDDPETNPDSDAIIKIAKAIHYLQTKTSTGQMYETGLEFLDYLQKVRPDLAKEVAPIFHAFIKSKL